MPIKMSLRFKTSYLPCSKDLVGLRCQIGWICGLIAWPPPWPLHRILLLPLLRLALWRDCGVGVSPAPLASWRGGGGTSGMSKAVGGMSKGAEFARLGGWLATSTAGLGVMVWMKSAALTAKSTSTRWEAVTLWGELDCFALYDRQIGECGKVFRPLRLANWRVREGGL